MQPLPFEWRGTVRYACPLCAWDTAAEEDVVEHVRWRHRKPGEVHSSVVVVEDEQQIVDMLIDEEVSDATSNIDQN